MDKVRLALVGCGGMGTRHLHGLKQLADSPFDVVELSAVCDISAENAEMAAAEAEKLLGVRPKVCTSMEAMVQQVPDLEAVDVVTDPSVHHTVVCEALDLGLHVLVEKPLAITVRACQRILDAAARNERIVSVAENFRRDPSARIVRHLLDTGAIGTPYMGMYHSLGAGNSIFITPWRHRRELGGFILDMAVHFTHMIRYQLGDFAEVYADARMIEPERQKSGSHVHGLRVLQKALRRYARAHTRRSRGHDPSDLQNGERRDPELDRRDRRPRGRAPRTNHGH